MNKRLAILIGIGVLLLSIVILFKTGVGTTVLSNLSGEGAWLLPLVVVAALVDSINPCAIGILILTVAFLLSLQKTRASILKIGSVYILGLFTVYFLIGLGILQALSLFNIPQFVSKAGAILLITLGGINIINEFFPSSPIKLRIPHTAHAKMASLMNKASLPAVFLLGALVGLYEFPCTGAAYLMVLGLLHDYETYFAGIGYLLLYNLIFILPLVIILLIASNKTLAEKVQEWKRSKTRRLRMWSGIAMIVLGILILII